MKKNSGCIGRPSVGGEIWGPDSPINSVNSASEVTYIVSGGAAGALNSTHSPLPHKSGLAAERRESGTGQKDK